jgi:hypothetical protein
MARFAGSFMKSVGVVLSGEQARRKRLSRCTYTVHKVDVLFFLLGVVTIVVPTRPLCETLYV